MAQYTLEKIRPSAIVHFFTELALLELTLVLLENYNLETSHTYSVEIIIIKKKNNIKSATIK